MINTVNLPPFKKMCVTIGNLPSSFMESMSYYEALCWLYKYFEDTLLPAINTNSEAITELQTAFITLKNYVDNYFDNLDVQEEINNKLDQMAENGTLTNLIKDYVDPLYESYQEEINQTVSDFTDYFETEISDMDSRIQSVASGSPAGVYATSAALSSADPDHSKIYLVSADNKWYYYDTTNSEWTAGGTYQSATLNESDLGLLNEVGAEILQNKYVPTIAGNVNSSGVYEINPLNTSRITDYIPIRDNDCLFFMGNVGSSYNIISFYDSSKSYISTGSIRGYGVEYGWYLKIPNTAAYVVMCNYPSDSVPTPYMMLYKQESLKDDVNFVLNTTRNLTYKVSPTLFGYVNTWQEFVKTQNAKRTPFIKIRDYTKIKYHANLSSAGYVIAYYNSSFEMLTDVSILGSGEELVTRDIPENAYYVILSNYGDVVENSYIELLNDPTEYNISGKNILIFGDSITDCVDITVSDDKTTAYSWRNPSNSYTKNGQTISFSMWPKLLNLNYGCKEIRNYAKTGASYKYQNRSAGNERQNLSYQIEVAINDKNNPNDVFNQSSFTPDIIIFALGTNDGESNDTYAAAMAKTVYISDTDTIDVDSTIANLDLTKFNEAVRYAMLTVKKEWPMAQIYVVLPIQRADRETLDTNDQLRKMALRYGAIIIDGSGNAGITREFDVVDGLGEYLKDGLHPNEKGQNLLTRLIVTSLFNNYIDFNNMNR